MTSYQSPRYNTQRRASNRLQAGVGILVAALVFIIFSVVVSAFSDLVSAVDTTDRPADVQIVTSP